MADLSPSEAQLEILQILWDQEPATVRQIHETMLKNKQVGYTTVLKQIQRMTEKGLVTAEKEGRSFVYRSSVQEGQIKKTLFDRLKDTAFKGSSIDLVMHALGNSKPSKEEIDQLTAWLAEKRKEQEG
ncbi:MAG: BlaI/MecI/CopY family transcriptional regulator [Bacteroidota bacterium]